MSTGSPALDNPASMLRGMQERAFWFSFIAGWIGILVYAGCLVASAV